MKWVTPELWMVSDVVSGFGFPIKDQGDTNQEFPFFKVGDMNAPGNERCMTAVVNTVSAATLKKLKAKAFPKGTVVFPKIGAAIATNKKRMLVRPSVVDNNVMGIVPGEGLNEWYLFYWMQQFDLRSVSNIGPVPSMRKSEVERVTIPLPPPSEQRRIVEILDQADSLRKKRAEADAKAGRILPALFYQMFGDPATNPKSWPVHPFSKLFSQDKTAVDESAGKLLPYLGLEHIESESGRILSSEVEALAVEVRGLAFRFGPQHVLYGKLRPYLNKVALPSFEGRCSTELVPLLPAAGVPREFVAAYLRLPYVVNAAMATNKGARMPRTDMHLLMAMKVPIPDVDSQRAFAVAYSTVSRTTEGNREAGRYIEDLFSVLLHRAFTGDLTAKWRESHMKELLAEMESQAKALESPNEDAGEADERPRRRRKGKE